MKITHDPQLAIKGLMIGAPQSGSGKTIATLALLRALKNHGINIGAAKVGPDFIDPQFHQLACGSQSINLDPWAMGEARQFLLANNQGAQNLLIESMMGLFDGAANGEGSGAHLARALGLPILLVVDAEKQSHSIAPLVHGFRDHDKRLNICGVILNKVGSSRHELMLRQALEAIDVDVLGVIYRSEELVLPSRHLGLVQAKEIEGIENFIERAAEIFAQQCGLEKIERCFSLIKQPAPDLASSRIPVPGQKIAIACDRAFSFIYPHLLKDWRVAGAQVTFFSPLNDEGPDQDVDAVYLPGGYPEIYGGVLAQAQQFKSQMKMAKTGGAMIYGECGGYMVLGKGLIDSEGERHAMLGFLDLETSFAQRKLHLGYRLGRANSAFFAGQNIFAHEFHYTSVTRQKGNALFEVSDALGSPLGKMGLREGNVMGSYLHLVDTR